MISVFLCSRGNPAANLPRLLDSAVKHLRPEERAHIEFLIHDDDDDDDDDRRPPESFFDAYPFRIRPFLWSRGEGRHSHALEYLFSQRDPRSRYCLLTADDFYFTRTGFVSEILSIQDEFCILGVNRPPIESFAGVYEDDPALRKWATSLGRWSPVVSARLIEVCQNLGWQSNFKAWLMGLSAVLYDLYKITLWRTHEPFYLRGGGNGMDDMPTYSFELLRRQARNLYRHMECGSDRHKTASASDIRGLWSKLRAQPLRRLPLRIYHKLWRLFGEALHPQAGRPAAHSGPLGDPTEWADDIPPEIFPPDAEVLTALLRRVRRPGMAVLEVGSWVGNGSTRMFAEAVREAGGTLYCVDTWSGSDNVENHLAHRERHRSLFSVFSENVRRYNAQDVVKPLVMASVEASRLFPDESLDLVFIDGNHAYSHVKEDLLAWLPKVRPGGVLCGHDCDASYEELGAELRSEIEKHCEDDVLHNPGLPGPAAFHPGVVKAVHEVLGRKAKLWVKRKPTTVWSCAKARGLFGFLKAPQVPQVAPTPWPDYAR